MGECEGVENVLIGRQRELVVADELLASLPAGGAGLLWRGDPGIGKTALLTEVARRAAAAGVRILRAAPTEVESAFALAGIHDLLSEVAAETRSALPRPQRRAVDIALLLSDPDPAPVEPRVLATGVLGVLRQLADAGLVLLVIDDLQWLDAPSGAAVEFALRRLGSAPVGLVATTRADPGEPLPIDSARVVTGGMREEALGPLPVAAVFRLLRDRLGLELTRPELIRVFCTPDGRDPRIEMPATTALPWGAVGYVNNGCTATLIAESWILSAGHCVTNVGDASWQQGLWFFPNFHPSVTRAGHGIDRAVVGAQADVGSLDWAIAHLATPVTDFPFIPLGEAPAIALGSPTYRRVTVARDAEGVRHVFAVTTAGRIDELIQNGKDWTYGFKPAIRLPQTSPARVQADIDAAAGGSGVISLFALDAGARFWQRTSTGGHGKPSGSGLLGCTAWKAWDVRLFETNPAYKKTATTTAVTYGFWQDVQGPALDGAVSVTAHVLPEKGVKGRSALAVFATDRSGNAYSTSRRCVGTSLTTCYWAGWKPFVGWGCARRPQSRRAREHRDVRRRQDRARREARDRQAGGRRDCAEGDRRRADRRCRARVRLQPEHRRQGDRQARLHPPLARAGEARMRAHRGARGAASAVP